MMSNSSFTGRLIRFALLLVGLIVGRLCSTLSAAPQSGNDFNYVCTATPYSREKALAVTATPAAGNSDMTPIAGKVSAPGGKYYLVTLQLKRGQEYEVSYTWGGATVYVDHEVTPPSNVPYLRLREMTLDPVNSVTGPKGYVLLRAQTENNDFDDSRIPDPKVSSSNGGETKRVTKHPGKGTFFVYVKPGFRYKIDYNIGGKRYGKEADVAANEWMPIWTLKDMGSNQPPACIFTYGPWEECEGGHKKRQVIMSPTGCVRMSEPVTDTICRVEDPPPPPPIPSPPVPAGCTSWSAPVWGNCANNVQHGTIAGIPQGCGSRDTTRQCTSAGEGIPRLSVEEDLDRDTCETLAALTWEYAPVMLANTAYTVYIRISEAALRKLQAETSTKLDLDKMDAGVKVEMGEEIYISDNISIELSSDRATAFNIERQGSGEPKPYRGRMLEFRWTVTPKEEVENAEFVATPTMSNCADGAPEERASRTSRVSVKVSFGDKIDQVVDKGTGTLTKIGVLLAAIAGVIGYFKGWFGGLFKRKGAGGEPTA